MEKESKFYTKEELHNITQFIEVLRAIQKRLLDKGYTIEDIRESLKKGEKLL